MKHPTTSQWYVTETNQWYVSTTSHYYVSTTSSVSHKPNTQITLLWYVSTTCVGVTLLRRSLRFQVTLVYRIIASPPIINFWEIYQPPLSPQFYSNRPIINFKDFTKSRNQKSQIFCMEQQKGVNDLLSKYCIVINCFQIKQPATFFVIVLHVCISLMEKNLKKTCIFFQETYKFTYIYTFAFIMYVVSIILLLINIVINIGTKKKIVLFFPPPPLPKLFQPPYYQFLEKFPLPPPLFGTREYFLS